MIAAFSRLLITCLLLLITDIDLLYSNPTSIPFIPPVYNYTTSNYKAGNQNWAIAQDKNGIIYFGNNNGLLSFDGTNWKLHTLPNNLSVKSIYIDSNISKERIYVGSFEEFGYFERNETGQLIYHSIKDKVADYDFHNDEIWSIHPYNGKLYFQSFSRIFIYDGNKVEILNPSPSVLYLFPNGDKMYAQLINNGLSVFDGENFNEILNRSEFNNDDIVSMIQLENDYLLATSKNGLFKYSEETGLLNYWSTELEEELSKAVINRAIIGDSAQFIIGTINKGLYALNDKGKVLWNINRNNGLYNNTILGLFSDRNKSIWAALDNGISNIRTSSPFTIYEPTDIQIGLVEEILCHEKEIHLATNQGVYSFSQKDGKFNPIPEFDVQSWFIKKFNDQIFIGHNFGTSVLENNRPIPVVGARTGGMDLKQVTLNGENFLLEASYTSLYLYRQNSEGKWTFSHAIEGFSDLIKNVEVDHTGNIWAGHMYKGVYRIKLDSKSIKVAEIESITSLNYTYSDYLPHINLMKLKGRIIFTDGNSFYTFDDINRKIILYDLLNNNLPGFADTYRIVPISNDLFWFIRNKEYSLVEFKEEKYVLKDRIPFSILNNPPNVGRANIFVSENGISYFSLNGGIGKYSLSQNTEPRKSGSLHFSSIRYYNRNNEESNYLNPQSKAIINYGSNNLDFSFSYPEFSKINVKVQTLLEGYDNRWVDTDKNNSVSYNNLPANEYILNARVLDSSGNQVDLLKYPFRIKSPWYISWWAYTLYLVVILLISGFISKRHVEKIIRKKSEDFAEQENKRLNQIEHQEKQIIKLRAEKLESDLIYKGKELASATMLIINHAEFLKKLKSQIQQYALEGKINRAESRTLINMIGEDQTDEDEWNVFQENFDLIHENFFRKLKDLYPSLTPSDLKLCTLLRLNYTTKEIARLLNISTRGVESARYRLRKKLNLDENDNLVDFLIEFK